ncbi:McrB family protein [Robinsoniella peoriensis]|uniref:McrB family protein n=1 Tax=Robinsoniella peoriensis TaxID=180332 RepID=UPI003750FE6B
MKSFDEIIEDMHGLVGLELSSLSGQAKKITITEVNENEKRVCVSVEDGTTDSRPFEEFEKITGAFQSNLFVHVDSALNGSGSSRNRPETIIASLPYIEWAHFDGKKRLVYMGENTHDIGKTKKMSEEDIKIFERKNTHVAGDEYKKAAFDINEYILTSGFSFEEKDEGIHQYYNEFFNRFSPQQIQLLSGVELLEKIFYTAESTNDSMCYWLEFHKEIKSYFGSISGGSSYKFGLFQKKDYTWVSGSPAKPEVLSEEEAVLAGTEIRDNILKGAKIIESFRQLKTVEDYEALDNQLNVTIGKYANMGWIHKYYHMTFPDKFATYHSSEWQKHILYAYGVKPSEKYYGRSGQLAIITSLAKISAVYFAAVSYDHYGEIRQFCRIGTSDGDGNYFTQWKRNKIVGIGWSKCGSLEKYLMGDTINKKTIADKLREEYYPNDLRLSSRKAGELVAFYKTNNNSVFVSMDGEVLLGLGDNIGKYNYDNQLSFAHTKPIEWHYCFLDGEKMPNKSEGLRTSCCILQDDDNLIYLYNKYYKDNLDKEEEDLLNNEEVLIENKEFKPRVNPVHPLNQIIYGAPGTGKTYSTVEFALAIIENRPVVLSQNNIEERTLLMERYNNFIKNGRIIFTTFHQSYGYEDFIQGIRPEAISGSVSFKKADGVFKVISDRALKDPENNYVIVIDEINRGNMSKIFGELITLIEDDKRCGELNQLSVTLPLGEVFTVPNNLYVIGTMNSADKSISLIDTAIRRRFNFIEMAPDFDVVRNEILRGVLQGLNNYLRKELRSTDLLVGHAYFMGKDEKSLPDIMNNNIIPLLYEYFYDDEPKVRKALECLNDTNVVLDEASKGRIRVKEKD